MREPDMREARFILDDVLMVFLSVKMMHISVLARHLRDARLGFWFVPKTHTHAVAALAFGIVPQSTT